MQRCWAHLIRGLRDISDKNPNNADAKIAFKRLQSIYHDAKMDVSANKRRALRRRVTRRMRRLIARYEDDPVIGGYMKKLEHVLPDAFRFVVDPNIAPTNNPAETLLREIVLHRKIRGSIRSEKTMLWMGYLSHVSPHGRLRGSTVGRNCWNTHRCILSKITLEELGSYLIFIGIVILLKIWKTRACLPACWMNHSVRILQ